MEFVHNFVKLFDFLRANSTKIILVKILRKLLGLKLEYSLSLEIPNNLRLYHKHFLGEVVLKESHIQKFQLLDARFLPRDWYAIQKRKSIFSVSDVVIDSRTGIIFCGENSANSITESAPIMPIETSEFLRPRVPRRIAKGEWTVLSSRSYAHWLLEDLPRFLEIKSLDDKLKVLISSKAASYTLDALEILGIQPNLASPVARVERAKFISAPAIVGLPTIETLETLRNFAELAVRFSPISDVNSHIYISRRGSSRSPIAEEQIEKLMIKYQIHVVQLEELRLWDQINLFRNAKLIIGPHGAGLFNFVWSIQKPVVMELYSESFIQDSVRAIANFHGVSFYRFADSNLKDFENTLVDHLEQSV